MDYYRELLLKYMAHVAMEEGTDFAEDWRLPDDMDEADKSELNALSELWQARRKIAERLGS